MKNKGFTLMELLGVIIILALLMIIVFPSIVNSVKNSSNKTDDLTKELIYNAADLFIDEHINDYPKENGNKYAIELKTLVEEGLLTSPIKLSDSDIDITNSKCIQVIYQGDYNYELKDSGTCEQTKILPSEYKQVEYIESTGTQWIDTGFIANQNTKIVVDYQYTTIKDGFLFGARESVWVSSYAVNIGSSATQNLTSYGASGNVLYSQPDTKRHVITKDKNLFYLDGVLMLTQSEKTFETPGNLEIFAAYNNGTKGYLPSSSKIFSFKIYDNDNLVRDFKPCYRVSDNVIGMYDTVNNVFYTNSGTGTFEKGNDI